jgi:cellulose synthase/poly-beta-1,6-N-acetylglucosamine synthase-like glycosyltransferase
MVSLLSLVLFVLALPLVLSGGYLLICTLLSSGSKPPSPSQRTLKFDVIVPAHNEATVIERTVASVKRIDWPADCFRILVIADNCTDATPALALAAGAIVLERTHVLERGKGYALQFAFHASRQHGVADAVVIIDADAEVSPNILEAFATRIESGEYAIQAHYGILNPFDSWRTRLITIAKASFHIVRSRARERLGLSCGIRGNGWCVTHELLTRVPYRSFSLTEDVEYGIALGLAGYRVAYADEAHSDAEMVTGEHIASKQRQRWESGRFELIRTKTMALLAAALRRRSAVCLDLALDLMVLPLSYVACYAVALTLIAALLSLWSVVFVPWIWMGATCIVILGLYVLRGWQLSGIGAQGLLDLAGAPKFLLWKLLLMFQRRNKNAEWVRTEREK